MPWTHLNKCFILGTVETISAKPTQVHEAGKESIAQGVFNFLFIKEPERPESRG